MAFKSSRNTCAKIGSEECTLSRAEEENVAQLLAPFPACAGFLREIAAGCPAAIPDGLPAELREWLVSLAAAL